MTTFCNNILKKFDGETLNIKKSVTHMLMNIREVCNSVPRFKSLSSRAGQFAYRVHTHTQTLTHAHTHTHTLTYTQRVYIVPHFHTHTFNKQIFSHTLLLYMAPTARQKQTQHSIRMQRAPGHHSSQHYSFEAGAVMEGSTGCLNTE